MRLRCAALIAWLEFGPHLGVARSGAEKRSMKDSSAASSPGSDQSTEMRLDSWKEIAAYVKRDVTTVQRWEKREGMPVHRHLHDKRGSVYALPSELETWLQSRREHLGTEENESGSEMPVVAEAEPGLRTAEQTATTQTRRSLRRWLILTAIGVTVLGGLSYLLLRSRGGDATPKIKSLAVLPLKNLSGDPSQEYVAEGMTEAFIGRLSNIHDLRVISRTSVMRFKDSQLPLPEIAKALHVDALVEGSVMREGSRIRVNAQLIRGATDEHIWSEAYDRELRDVLALQSDVAQAIAGRVAVTLTGTERQRLTAVRPISPEVYESYLKGRYALEESNSRAGIEESIARFEEAIRRDSTFAPAYLGLAAAYDDLSLVFIGSPPEKFRPKVISTARKALELDPQLAEAHVLIGSVQQEDWHWAEAEAEYKRALGLNPNSAAAHAGLASWLLCQGRTDEALDWARRGRELDPLAVSGAQTGWILFQARRYDESIHELRSELAVRGDDAFVLWFLGFALTAKGQHSDAIRVLEKALSVSDRSPGVIGVLVRAYAQAGRRADALRLLDELKTRNQAGYVPAAAFVNAYLGLGDKEQAFAWLERAYQEHSNILQFVKVHPFFDLLRQDPRFADLVRRVGLG